VTAPLLEVDNLSVQFVVGRGRRKRIIRAVQDASFSIGHGETLAVVGESGSGKSTTAQAILGLVNPSAGSVMFEGSDLLKNSSREMREVRRHLQVVFQDPYSSLDPMMTVADLIAEPLDNFEKLSSAARSDKVGELLELVRLPANAATRYPHEFSGGQRQRIAIARALAVNPKLIICDEAVSALDVSIRNQILTLLRDLQEQLGVSYLFIGHDLSMIEQFAERVAVMYLGRIVETGTVEEVFRSPRHQYTGALLSAIPTHHKALRAGRIILQGEIPDPASPPSGCVFHPRCPAATEICGTTRPPAVQTKSGEALCHHPLEIDSRG